MNGGLRNSATVCVEHILVQLFNLGSVVCLNEYKHILLINYQQLKLSSMRSLEFQSLVRSGFFPNLEKTGPVPVSNILGFRKDRTATSDNWSMAVPVLLKTG